MELVGRITKDATIGTAKKNNRKVVSFTLAVNDYYKPKDAEKSVKVTTYFDCAYWVNPSIASYLMQGTIVEVHGRIYATAYMGKNGEPKASINCHVNSIKLHKTGSASLANTNEPVTKEKEDLPF
jgi:single-strand DNA-binding protein